MNKLLFTLLFMALASGRASAVLIVNDGFESYGSKEEFASVWVPIGMNSPASAVLSLANASSGQQSVEIPRTNDTGQYQNRLTFAATPLLGIGDELVWSFDFYDKVPAAFPRAHYASLQTEAAPSAFPAGQKISLGMNNNQLSDDSGGNHYMASIVGHSHSATDPDGGPNETSTGTGPGAFFKLNDTGAGLRGENEAWHNLTLVISTTNGTTVDHKYYVDGALAETVNNVGPNLQYSAIQIGSGLPNGLRIAYFDNMQLEFITSAVPEAGSFAAVGLVGLLSAGAVWMRKRRA